jgi:transcriptional regulator with XRE-family HTH domain
LLGAAEGEYASVMNVPATAAPASSFPVRSVGDLLRRWRQQRRYSQLALACDAEISPKHLSFVESGRARPSRDMVLRLAERLEVPLRERNALLLAAGFAPAFKEHTLQDPDLASVRRAVDLVLAGHEPYPALAVDRHWTLVAANKGIAPLLAGASPELLAAPSNVLRLALHPRGLAPRIVNFAEWCMHVLARLRHQAEQNADPVLSQLLAELQGYAGAAALPPRGGDESPASHMIVPLRLNTADGVWSFISTTMVFGTPLDVTSSELAIESFFPGDEATARALRGAGCFAARGPAC